MVQLVDRHSNKVALVQGSGYERIATPGCWDRTIRRSQHAWVEAGLAQHLHALVLAQYELTRQPEATTVASLTAQVAQPQRNRTGSASIRTRKRP